MAATALVGRARQLTVLRDALSRAVAGEGGVLVVRGDPGVGKSTLVATALDTVDVTRFLGHAVPGGSRPGRAVSEIAVAALAAGAQLDDPGVALFRRPVEALIGTTPAGPGVVENPAAFGPLGAAVGEGVLRLLELAADRPVAVFEDLHWADADTQSVVEYLADHIHGRRAALVITHRTGESADTDAMTVRIGRSGWSTVVDLTGLPDAAVDQMTSARLPAGPVPSGLAADVRAFAEGVPLLVEEFLSCALDDGTLRLVQGQWLYEPGRRPRPPASMRESIEVRVRRLGPVGRRLLLAGALLGHTFDAGLVTRGLHLDIGTVADAVRVAVLGGLVRPGSQPDQVEFRHALIRDAMDAMLVPPERTGLARSLLAALPTGDGEPAGPMIEVAADLARQAGHLDRAAGYYLRAGQDAIRRGAASAGTMLLERAVDLAVGTDLGVTARIALVDGHALTGHVARALQAGDAVLRQLDGDPAATAQVHLSMARAAADGQLWATARSHLDAAAGTTDPAAESALRAVVALGAGDRAAAIDHATRAAALARTGGAAPAVACEAYEVLGRCARAHDLTAARGWFDRAVGVAEQHHLMLWRARALHELATISQLQNLALDDLRRARQAALDAGAPGLLAAVEFHIAAIHGVRFEPEPALAAARRCLDEARRVGVTRQQAWGWILIGQAHAAAGRRAQAGAAADEAQRLAPGDPEVLGLATGTCRGLASLLCSDRDRAVTQFRAGIEQLRPLPRVPLPPWYLWPLIALVWTDTEGPRALAEADDPALRVAAGPNALWQLAAAVAAGRTGDPAAAHTYLGRAEQAFRTLPGFTGYRHIGLRLAAEAAITDHWGDPGRWLTDAETWSTSMGFDAFAASCRALQRRAGVRQRRRGRGGTPVPAELAALGITSREADVLTLVAAGMTNPQIAERLYISPRTAKSHVEALLRKTGSTGRTQLATLAAAHGLTDPTGNPDAKPAGRPMSPTPRRPDDP